MGRDYHGDSPIHVWFGLSHSSYLVLPRSALQTMPDPWQARLVELIEELQATIDLDAAGSKEDLTHCYEVRMRGPGGRFVDDPLREYGRGCRLLPLKAADATSEGRERR